MYIAAVPRAERFRAKCTTAVGFPLPRREGLRYDCSSAHGFWIFGLGWGGAGVGCGSGRLGSAMARLDLTWRVSLDSNWFSRGN